MLLRPRIRRVRGGGYKLALPAQERDVLRGLPAQLTELLDADEPDPVLVRLFPPAYTDDDEQEAEYQRLMSGDLRERRKRALAVMAETIDAEHLDDDQLGAWLSALNDLRLVLGTRLDVREEWDGDDLAPDDPRTPVYALYAYLSWLLEQVVEALTEGLPEPTQ